MEYIHELHMSFHTLAALVRPKAYIPKMASKKGLQAGRSFIPTTKAASRQTVYIYIYLSLRLGTGAHLHDDLG